MDAALPTDPNVVGPDALKGLAHPLRLRLLAELNARGSATASQLGAVLGESSGSTSYHLRQLHRHGFVEEDEDSGTGRERVWIPRRGGWSLPVFELAEDPGNVAAVDLVLQAQMQADQQRLLDVMARARSWPQEWQDATVRRDTDSRPARSSWDNGRPMRTLPSGWALPWLRLRSMRIRASRCVVE